MKKKTQPLFKLCAERCLMVITLDGGMKNFPFSHLGGCIYIPSYISYQGDYLFWNFISMKKNNLLMLLQIQISLWIQANKFCLLTSHLFKSKSRSPPIPKKPKISHTLYLPKMRKGTLTHFCFVFLWKEKMIEMVIAHFSSSLCCDFMTDLVLKAKINFSA